MTPLQQKLSSALSRTKSWSFGNEITWPDLSCNKKTNPQRKIIIDLSEMNDLERDQWIGRNGKKFSTGE